MGAYGFMTQKVPFVLYELYVYTFEQGSNLYMFRPPLGYERIFSDYVVFHKPTAWDRLQRNTIP